MAAALPAELMAIVVASLDDMTLTVVVRVCRAFRDGAMAELRRRHPLKADRALYALRVLGVGAPPGTVAPGDVDLLAALMARVNQTASPTSRECLTRAVRKMAACQGRSRADVLADHAEKVFKCVRRGGASEWAFSDATNCVMMHAEVRTTLDHHHHDGESAWRRVRRAARPVRPVDRYGARCAPGIKLATCLPICRAIDDGHDYRLRRKRRTCGACSVRFAPPLVMTLDDDDGPPRFIASTGANQRIEEARQGWIDESDGATLVTLPPAVASAIAAVAEELRFVDVLAPCRAGDDRGDSDSGRAHWRMPTLGDVDGDQALVRRVSLSLPASLLPPTCPFHPRTLTPFVALFDDAEGLRRKLGWRKRARPTDDDDDDEDDE